jgi:hypothetical protein
LAKNKVFKAWAAEQEPVAAPTPAAPPASTGKVAAASGQEKRQDKSPTSVSGSGTGCTDGPCAEEELPLDVLTLAAAQAKLETTKGMLVRELKATLLYYGLEATGKKQQLSERLQVHIESNPGTLLQEQDEGARKAVDAVAVQPVVKEEKKRRRVRPMPKPKSLVLMQDNDSFEYAVGASVLVEQHAEVGTHTYPSYIPIIHTAHTTYSHTILTIHTVHIILTTHRWAP